MNNTAQGVDARKYLVGWLEVVTDMTIKDIRHVPESNWVETMGGKARTGGQMLADTITNLIWTTETIKGETSNAYERMHALAEELKQKHDAISRLKQASQELAAAITEADDESLNRVAMAPWKLPTPVMMLAQIAVSHIWYHDGQINYIQTLLGDEEVHWLE